MLPSLRGLHALKLLARSGRLSIAAEQLGVTRSALSHRIADLEAQLGVALVRKQGRTIVLTDDAEALLLTIGDAVERIEAAVEPLHRRPRELRISTVGTFASLWLLPRLGDFRVRHPDIELSISTTRRAVDFEGEEFDCAIRHGLGTWGSLASQFLFRETLVPVASPSLGTALEGMPLIRARSRMRDWERWWGATRRPGHPSAAGLLVENRAQALEAALGGAGAVMMDSIYIHPHLATGVLQPLADTAQLTEGYFLVHRRRLRNDRLVKTFGEWLQERLRADEVLRGTQS